MITRVNISIPEDTYKRIKKAASKRGVSKFLVEAAEEKISQSEKRKAFESLVKASSTFRDIKASSDWVKRLRSEDEKRLKRLGL